MLDVARADTPAAEKLVADLGLDDSAQESRRGSIPVSIEQARLALREDGS